MNKFRTEGFWSGRAASHPSNPLYPNGIEVDLSEGRQACTVDLPYPAPSVGHWLVKCEICGFSGIITAAGRRDDPRRVRVPCKIEGTPQ